MNQYYPQPYYPPPTQNIINIQPGMPGNMGQLRSFESFFDGSMLEQLGYTLLAVFISILTLGIAAPWGICMLYNWETKHTVINGQRLRFDGTGAQLFGNWIKWFLLSLNPFGIYGFWLNSKLKQWIVKHTHFQS
jgi:uncharacterized membrane protein YjgN (DUF898 family)